MTRPLHFACQTISDEDILLEVVKKLVNFGADVNSQDSFGRTVTLLSPKRIALFLVDCGADKQSLIGRAIEDEDLELLEKCATNETDFNEYSYEVFSIIVCDSEGTIPIFEYIISKGFDVNVRGYFNGNTLIHEVINRQDTLGPMLDYLIFRGLDINARNYTRETPLHLMTKDVYYSERQFGELLKRGADLSLVDNEGDTPVQNAKNFEHRDLAEFLKKVRKRTNYNIYNINIILAYYAFAHIWGQISRQFSFSLGRKWKCFNLLFHFFLLFALLRFGLLRFGLHFFRIT